MKKLNTFLCVIGAILLSSCIIIGNSVNGSGFVITESRAVSGVTAVRLAGIGDLRITIGEVESLVIETDDNLMRNITTEQIGSTLIIDTHQGLNLNPSKNLTYNLVLKELKGLELKGSGNVSAMNIHSNNLGITLNGVGNITLGGESDSLTLELRGTGDIKALNLRTSNAVVKLSGVGNVGVWAKEKLHVNLSGIGDVKYRGHPNLTTSVTGLGSVTPQY
ncbi:MAG TPA: head GIN domain-containing protein [Treponemataceae bacterium]|nr:head GIN domain-containing protein [Treponemataceae bacterium]